MSKLFDLRFIIGLFFTVVGLMLLIYGLMTRNEVANAHEVNRWCGACFTLFGLIMIVLSFQKDAHDELLEKDAGAEGRTHRH